MSLPAQCAAILNRATVAAMIVGRDLEYRLLFLHIPAEAEADDADRQGFKTLAVIAWSAKGGLELEMFPDLTSDEKRLVLAARSEFLGALANLPGAVVGTGEVQ